NGAEREKIIEEINAHRELQGTDEGCQQVIGLKGIIGDDDGNLFMVQEFAGGGGVDKLGQNLKIAQDNGVISPEARRLMGLYALKEALQGLDYMHSERQMMHLDFKPENLMIGSDGHIKLIDFGTSQTGTQIEYENDQVENAYNRAPERLLDTNLKRVGPEVDVWSAGIVAYNLLRGSHEEIPLWGDHIRVGLGAAIMDFGRNVDGRMLPQQDHPSLEDQAVAQLINGLFAPTPEQRLTAGEALQLSLFQDPRLNTETMTRLFQKFSAPLVPNPMDGLPELGNNPSQEELQQHEQLIAQLKLESAQLRFAMLEPELRELGV
ncbi:MAG TPA: protein kinase, partial [Candidatus Obscuribacterales bacterium]